MNERVVRAVSGAPAGHSAFVFYLPNEFEREPERRTGGVYAVLCTL